MKTAIELKHSMTFLRLTTLLLAILLSFATLTVNAQPVSKQRAVEVAQQQFPGRVLSVKLKGNHYSVKILNDKGDVRIIKVSSNSDKRGQ